MRGLITLGLALTVGGAPLAAQHANQFELGLFGAYTRYDKTSSESGSAWKATSSSSPSMPSRAAPRWSR